MKNDYKSFIHAVLDLETLALDERAVILSIGMSIVVWKDMEYQKAGEFYLNLRNTVLEQILQGRTIDPETVAWWNDPKRVEALQLILEEPSTENFGASQRETVEYLKVVAPKKNGLMLWGNGAGFDCNKFESLLPNLNIPFWLHRCLRSVTDVLGIEIARNVGVFHHALADAKNQGDALIAALTKLEKINE